MSNFDVKIAILDDLLKNMDSRKLQNLKETKLQKDEPAPTEEAVEE